jgi:hypothetical protein
VRRTVERCSKDGKERRRDRDRERWQEGPLCGSGILGTKRPLCWAGAFLGARMDEIWFAHSISCLVGSSGGLEYSFAWEPLPADFGRAAWFASTPSRPSEFERRPRRRRREKVCASRTRALKLRLTGRLAIRRARIERRCTGWRLRHCFCSRACVCLGFAFWRCGLQQLDADARSLASNGGGESLSLTCRTRYSVDHCDGEQVREPQRG